MLKTMLEEKVLIYNNKKYCIDLDWIKQMKLHYSNLEKKLSKNTCIFDNKDNLCFENINLSIIYDVLSVIEKGLEFISTKERDGLDYEFVFDASVMFKMKNFFKNPILNKNIKQQLRLFKNLMEKNKFENQSEVYWNFKTNKKIFGTFLMTAFMTPNFLGNKYVKKATTFLINTQKSDGSWFEGKINDNTHYNSPISLTANVLWVLRMFGSNSDKINNSIPKAVKFLENNRITKGKDKGFWKHSFGTTEPDIIYPTYITLYELGQHNKNYLKKYKKQLDFLLSMQDKKGCWPMLYFGKDEKIVGTYMGLALLVDSIGDLFSERTIKGIMYICRNATPSGKIGKHANVTAMGLHRLIWWLKKTSYL